MIMKTTKAFLEWLKKVFYAVIVKSQSGLQGVESTFEFKYVPEYSTITEMGQCEEEKASFSHVERRNLKSFLLGVGVMGIGSWIAYQVGAGIWRMIAEAW